MATSNRIALTNVRVFDGAVMREPSTVVLEGNIIGDDATGATEIDGHGAFLLPGLIDAHIHLNGVQSLKNLRRHGVTTALDMASWPPARVDALRGLKGHTDIRSAGIPATAPGTTHSHIPGFAKEALLSGPEQAPKFVADRVAEGADYIKVIADIPGPDQATLNAVVVAAHEHKKLVIAHTSAFEPFRMAQEAKVDIVTHVPLDKPLDSDAVACMLAENRVAVPTLTMMEGIINRLHPYPHPKGRDYAHGRASVTAMYHGGVPILAGTDANDAPGVPTNVPHGESLHHELELLVDAGLSKLDALRAATSLPAKHFGLNDRGIIEIGRRADLVLLGANPLMDIRATRHILRVWCGGIEIPQGTTQDTVASTVPKEMFAPTGPHQDPAASTASEDEFASTARFQAPLASAAPEGVPVLNGASGSVESSTAPTEEHIHSGDSHGTQPSTALQEVDPSTNASRHLQTSTAPRYEENLDGAARSKLTTAPEALSASSGTSQDLKANTSPEAVASTNNTSESSTTPETVHTPDRVMYEPEVSQAPVADQTLEGASYGALTPPASEALAHPNGVPYGLEASNTLMMKPDNSVAISQELNAPVSAAILDGTTHDLETPEVRKELPTPDDTSDFLETSTLPRAGSMTRDASHSPEIPTARDAGPTFDNAATASVSTAALKMVPNEA